MRYTIEVDKEEDGRWLAEVMEIPGVMVYGQTKNHAIFKAKRLTFQVIADQAEAQEEEYEYEEEEMAIADDLHFAYA